MTRIGPGLAAVSLAASALTFMAGPAQAAVCNVPTTGQGSELAVWGDSMAYGVGADPDQTWPALLGQAVGVDVFNGGVPGERIGGIAARQGGVPAVLDEQLVVPATTRTASFDFAASQDIVFKRAGLPGFELPGRLVDNSGAASVVVAGTLDKPTYGANQRNHRFTRSAAGAAVTFPPGSQFNSDMGRQHRGDAIVIWAGHNDFTDKADAETVADIAPFVCQMVTFNGVQDFLVLGLTNGPADSGIDSDYYDRAIANTDAAPADPAVSEQLATMFGASFLDVRGELIAAREAMSRTEIPIWARCDLGEDTADLDADIVPCSFRQANFGATVVDRSERETVHLNPYGQCLAAGIIGEKLDDLGWFTPPGPAADCSTTAPPA